MSCKQEALVYNQVRQYIPNTVLLLDTMPGAVEVTTCCGMARLGEQHPTCQLCLLGCQIIPKLAAAGLVAGQLQPEMLHICLRFISLSVQGTLCSVHQKARTRDHSTPTTAQSS